MNFPEQVWMVLDELGLKYSRRFTLEGVPFAGFEMEYFSGNRIRLSMLLCGTFLVIRAFDLKMENSEGFFLEMNTLNQAWGLGRAYYLPEKNTWNLGTGVYINLDDPDIGAIATAIEALCKVALFLQSDPDVREMSLDKLIDDLWSPYPPKSVPIKSLALILDQANYAFESHLDDQLLVQRFIGENRNDFLIDIYGVADRFLFLRGQFDQQVTLDLNPKNLRALQNVNAKLSLGAAGIRRESGRPWFILGFPTIWSPIKIDTLKLLIDHIADAVYSLEKNLGLRKVNP